MLSPCYFRIADITILVDSDLPVNVQNFEKKFASFACGGPDEDTVSIHHHFGIPEFQGEGLGTELYRKAPWAIFRTGDSYIYHGISALPDDPSLHQVAQCTLDHNHMEVFHNKVYEEVWLSGGLQSLTMFPTDQILIARLLADRQGFIIHSAGVIINGVGMLFVGHSEAGKSTTTNFLIDAGASGRLNAEILCDDRNIVRRRPEGWRVYGTWSHGDVPLVSSASAPIRGICFIEKAGVNQIEPIADPSEVTRRLLACLIRPFVTADWWEKTLDHVALLVREVPCYRMRFDKSGAIVEEIARIANSGTSAVS